MNTTFGELRNFTAEVRQLEEGEEGAKVQKIVGKPTIYNSLSDDLGGFRERFLPHSFQRTLNERNVKSFWNHNSDYVLGSCAAGTMTLRDTDSGLDYEATPPNTQWWADRKISLDRGDVNQMSIMFRAREDRWILDDDGVIIREIIDADLYEVSPVALPAYPQTSVSLRTQFGTDDQNAIKTKIKELQGQPLEHRYDEIDDRLEALKYTI